MGYSRIKPTCDCWELDDGDINPFYYLKPNYGVKWRSLDWKYCPYCGVAGEFWDLTPIQGA